jgi:hypothetical protein
MPESRQLVFAHSEMTLNRTHAGRLEAILPGKKTKTTTRPSYFERNATEETGKSRSDSVLQHPRPAGCKRVPLDYPTENKRLSLPSPSPLLPFFVLYRLNSNRWVKGSEQPGEKERAVSADTDRGVVVVVFEDGSGLCRT